MTGDSILLRDTLPSTVTIAGVQHPIRWGFRTGMKLDCMRNDARKTKAENIIDMVNAFYVDPPTALSVDPRQAVNEMLIFFTRGAYEPPSKENKSAKKQKATPRAYDFSVDGDVILGDFMAHYGMMLNRYNDEDLHWWEFMALFSGLPEKSTIHQYMYYRTANLQGMTKAEQSRIKKVRAKIRIRKDYGDRDLTPAKRLENRNGRWLAIARNISQ